MLKYSINYFFSPEVTQTWIKIQSSISCGWIHFWITTIFWDCVHDSNYFFYISKFLPVRTDLKQIVNCLTIKNSTFSLRNKFDLFTLIRVRLHRQTYFAHQLKSLTNGNWYVYRSVLYTNRNSVCATMQKQTSKYSPLFTKWKWTVNHTIDSIPFHQRLWRQ